MIFEDKHFNPFMWRRRAGRRGWMISTATPSIIPSWISWAARASAAAQSNGRPIQPPDAAGHAALGRAMEKGDGGDLWPGAWASAAGFVLSGCADNYLDLDPTYKDRHGRPLLRITFDFPDNDVGMQNWIGQIAAKIAKAMNPDDSMTVGPARKGWNSVPYQTTHNTGGAIMGADPKTSAVNHYLQSWDVSNVFVIGASRLPAECGINPTGTVGALAYLGGGSDHERYLKSPGPLVQA